jgi:mono/diheme cytochrome c family protein
MDGRWSVFAAMAAMYVMSFALVSARAPQQAPNPNGWNLPPTASDEKNPVAGDPKAISAGKELFLKNCKRCHGPGGLGDGPDADPDTAQDMDLTVAKRASRNPDGVVFYKIWNGRKKPKMPAVKDEGITKDQAWQIVAFVQTLRKTS